MEIFRAVTQLIHNVLAGNQAGLVAALLHLGKANQKIIDIAGIDILSQRLHNIRQILKIRRPVKDIARLDECTKAVRTAGKQVHRLVGRQRHRKGLCPGAAGLGNQLNVHIQFLKGKLIDRRVNSGLAGLFSANQVLEMDGVGLFVEVWGPLGRLRRPGCRGPGRIGSCIGGASVLGRRPAAGSQGSRNQKYAQKA